MTRVLHVVPTYWPAVRYGGTIASVHALARAQVSLGMKVDVLTTSVDGPQDLDVPLGEAVNRDGVHIRYHRVPWLRRLYRAPTLAESADAMLPGTSVVHLHSVFLWPTYAVARRAVRAGVPHVVSPRGMLVRRLIDARGRLRKRAWIALVERSTLRAASMIHVTSEIERDDLLALDLGRLPPIEVICNGVDVPEDRFAPRCARFVFVGRLSWKKRIDWAIRALCHVPGFSLDVVGPDEDGIVPALVDASRRLGVADRVRFHGLLAPAERDEVLWKASALVLPSMSENFGNVVAEALACACPAVVTEGVGAAALVRASEAGAVVADENGLVDALRSIAGDPGRAARAGVRGRAFVTRELSWAAVAKRMLDAYARHGMAFLSKASP